MELIGLMFLQVALLFFAAIAGTTCAFIVYDYTRGMARGRRGVAILVAGAFPLLVLLYLEAGILGYGFAERAVGEDNFLVGYYHVPLPNGRQLVIFDKMPQLAYIEQMSNPNRGGVFQVHALQTAGNMLLVATYQGAGESDLGMDEPANRFLLIDTNTSGVREYSTLEALKSSAASENISLHLTPVEEILGERKSPGWRGLLFLVLLLLPPVVIVIRLARKLTQLGQRLSNRDQALHFG